MSREGLGKISFKSPPYPAGLRQLEEYRYFGTTSATAVTIDLGQHFGRFRDFGLRWSEQLVNVGATSTATGVEIRVTFSVDGSSFLTGATNYNWLAHTFTTTGNVATGSAAASEIRLWTATNNLPGFNDQTMQGWFWIFDAGDAGDRTYMSWDLGFQQFNDNPVHANGHGSLTSSGGAMKVRFNFGTGGSVGAGVVELWGIERMGTE